MREESRLRHGGDSEVEIINLLVVLMGLLGQEVIMRLEVLGRMEGHRRREDARAVLVSMTTIS